MVKLGDFNHETFFEEYSEIFFNLVILFQLRGHNYDFLFPYMDKKLVINNQPYNGFNPNTLSIKRTEENKYINKNYKKTKTNWYEDIVIPESRLKQKRFSKIISSRKGSVGSFKTFEPLNSAVFFKKNIKKKDKSNFYSLKYSRTLNEN